MLRCLVWAVGAASEVYVDALISRPLRDLPAGRVFFELKVDWIVRTRTMTRVMILGPTVRKTSDLAGRPAQ